MSNRLRNTKIRSRNYNPIITRSELTREYRTKYFEMFMNQFKFEGISPEAQYTLMRSFWSDGTIAAFMAKGHQYFENIEDRRQFLFFAPYAGIELDPYDFPKKAQLVNKVNAPFIPKEPLMVHKEVVLGYINNTFEPVNRYVYAKIKRIVAVDMVINTNLNLHKMPFSLIGEEKDAQKITDLINRLLEDEIAMYMTPKEVAMIKSINTNTPYIIDKLYMYKNSLENELLTYMGIDNNMVEKKERAIVDEINANNAEINLNAQKYLKHIKDFFDEINELFDLDIKVSLTSPMTDSVHEDVPDQDQEDQEGDNE